MGDDLSDWAAVASGVPQGSVLGPLLFILYVNDIADRLPQGVTTKLFADDVKLFSEIDSPTKSTDLQAALDIVQDWALGWQLSLASQKCSVLHIGPNVNREYRISNVLLPVEPVCRDLGVHISQNLKWSDHCSVIAKKGNQTINILFRCFLSASKAALVRAYVRPGLEYCSQ
ncbi:MAG: hypothetical protein GY696_03475, partial [Gammaproteobacteria bacterium]|nr:hypothetical protein [Gammaproteobacteria bacterium]